MLPPMTDYVADFMRQAVTDAWHTPDNNSRNVQHLAGICLHNIDQAWFGRDL